MNGVLATWPPDEDDDPIQPPPDATLRRLLVWWGYRREPIYYLGTLFLPHWTMCVWIRENAPMRVYDSTSGGGSSP